MVDEKGAQGEVKPIDVMSSRERISLSLVDFFTISMVILDLLYFGGLLLIDGTIIMVLNVTIVTLSFVGYNLKKRIRKRVELEKLERKSSVL